jgi:hypothetical protein
MKVSGSPEGWESLFCPCIVHSIHYYRDVAGYLHSNCTGTAQKYEAEEGGP